MNKSGVKLLMDVSKMRTLQLERGIIPADDDFEDTGAVAVLGSLQLAHALLQQLISIGKAFADGWSVAGTTGDVVVGSIRVDDAELVLDILLVRQVRTSL